MKFVKKKAEKSWRVFRSILTLSVLLTLVQGQVNPDMINEQAIQGTRPDEDPNLKDITPATKEEVDEALDDDLETINRDETKLNTEDEMALEDLARGFNPMAESSEATDSFEDLEDQIHAEEHDTGKEYGLFDLESNSEQQHLLNFKKVAEDFKIVEERFLECLRKIPQEAWVLRELVICVGRNFGKIESAMDYERKVLLARAESRVRRVMTDECYSDAGLDLSHSRSCDLMEKDILELLWDEMNYPALVKYHQEKYTFTYGQLKVDKFDKYLGFFAELYRRDSELLEEIANHGKIALLNIKKFIDDTTEHYAAEARSNGYAFNMDLTGEGLHTVEHSHFHAIGAYDASFNHEHEDDRFHDYVGDHAVEVYGHSQEGTHSSGHDHRISPDGTFKPGPPSGPPANNMNDIMHKYEDNEPELTSEDSEEYAQRIKDLAGYKDPEEEQEEDEEEAEEASQEGEADFEDLMYSKSGEAEPVEEAESAAKRRFRKRKLVRPHRVRSVANSRRVVHKRMYPMHKQPVHRRLPQNIRRNEPRHSFQESRRIRQKLEKRMHPRKLEEKTGKSKKEMKKSISEILSDYSKNLPGLKSGNLGHILKV